MYIYIMSTPFWINKPSILINQEYMLQFWPTEKKIDTKQIVTWDYVYE